MTDLGAKMLPGKKSAIPVPGSASSSRKRQRSPDQENGPQSQRFCEGVTTRSSSGNTPLARMTSGSSLSGGRKGTVALKKNKSTASLSSTFVGPPSNTAKPLPRAQFNGRPSQIANTRTQVSATRPGIKKGPATMKPPAAAPGNSAKTSNDNSKQKRPAWDLKGRIQDMEEMRKKEKREKDSLQAQMELFNSRIATLETQKAEQQTNLTRMQSVNAACSTELEGFRMTIREKENELKILEEKSRKEQERLTSLYETTQRKLNDLEETVASYKAKVRASEELIGNMQATKAMMDGEIAHTKALLQQSQEHNECLTRDNNRLHETIKGHEDTIASMKQTIFDHESERRVLHNMVQELKGNIRVFLRVRPLLGNENVGLDGQHIMFDGDQKSISLDKPGELDANESCLASGKRGAHYEFKFDRVFQPTCTQEDVFDEVQQVIQSALDGYNVCIFAYGQTGSGKTFTMEGGPLGQNEGIISRAVLMIFNKIQQLQEYAWTYNMEASFMEIYNDSINDLLAAPGTNTKHLIKKIDNEIMVTDMTTVSVTSADQIYKLLKKAAETRAVAETKCNMRSSRSHSIFRLRLSGTNSKTGEGCIGSLSLVDLAGSEKVKESGSEGARLTEAININKSLSCLHSVIMALSNKDPHVPYRNCKLTHVLQSSLGGNSKTLMIVNVSPKESNFQETLCSLRFATTVNQCSIGTARKKIKSAKDM